MVEETIIPKNSLLQNYFKKIYYKDSFRALCKNQSITVNDVLKSFFTSAPPWVIFSMKIRDKIASVLNLKVNGIKDHNAMIQNSNFNVGESYGLFTITEKTDQEVIMGTDDRHLNFRVSLYVEKIDQHTYIYISTIVQINNKVGWLYFNTIDLFHKIIVKKFLKNICRNLEQQ